MIRNLGWYKTLFILWLLCVLGAPAAFAKPLTARIDCYLPAPITVSCSRVVQAYFSSVSMVSQVREGEASDLSITVRAIKEDNDEKYFVSFETNGSFMKTDDAEAFSAQGANPKPPGVSIIDTIPTSLSMDAMNIRVLGDLQKGTAPFLALFEPGNSQNNTLTLNFSSPDALPDHPAEPGDKDPNKGWYVLPSVSGYGSFAQGQSINASSSLAADYSDSSWRVYGSGSASYQKLEIPINDTMSTGQVINIGAKTIVVRSFPKGWSVAAILSAEHSGSSNLQAQVSGDVGVEWNLVPFLSTEDRTVIVRYMAGPEYSDYIKTNIQGRDSNVLFKHTLETYFAWHFGGKADLSTCLAASSPISNYKYATLSGSLSLSWQLVKNLYLSPSISLSFSPERITAPLYPDYSNAAQSSLEMGAASAQLISSVSLSLSYTIGKNTIIKSRDKRWQ